MRTVIGWLIVVGLVLALIYIIVSNIHLARVKISVARMLNGGEADKLAMKALNKYAASLEKQASERERRFQQAAEYNKAHLPFAELPELSLDWEKFDEVVKRSSGLMMKDIGDSYACIMVYASEHYERHFITKSELDGDTIKLIELLLSDLDWFYAHPTGNSAGECGRVLESFLREKYPKLTEKSVNSIVNRYCVNDR